MRWAVLGSADPRRRSAARPRALRSHFTPDPLCHGPRTLRLDWIKDGRHPRIRRFVPVPPREVAPLPGCPRRGRLLDGSGKLRRESHRRHRQPTTRGSRPVQPCRCRSPQRAPRTRDSRVRPARCPSNRHGRRPRLGPLARRPGPRRGLRSSPRGPAVRTHRQPTGLPGGRARRRLHQTVRRCGPDRRRPLHRARGDSRHARRSRRRGGHRGGPPTPSGAVRGLLSRPPRVAEAPGCGRRHGRQRVRPAGRDLLRPIRRGLRADQRGPLRRPVRSSSAAAAERSGSGAGRSPIEGSTSSPGDRHRAR